MIGLKSHACHVPMYLMSTLAAALVRRCGGIIDLRVLLVVVKGIIAIILTGDELTPRLTPETAERFLTVPINISIVRPPLDSRLSTINILRIFHGAFDVPPPSLCLLYVPTYGTRVRCIITAARPLPNHQKLNRASSSIFLESLPFLPATTRTRVNMHSRISGFFSPAVQLHCNMTRDMLTAADLPPMIILDLAHLMITSH